MVLPPWPKMPLLCAGVGGDSFIETGDVRSWVACLELFAKWKTCVHASILGSIGESMSDTFGGYKAEVWLESYEGELFGLYVLVSNDAWCSLVHVDLESSELPIVVNGVGMVRWLDIGRCLEVVNVIFMVKVLRLPRHVRSKYNMWVRFQFSGVGGRIGI